MLDTKENNALDIRCNYKGGGNLIKFPPQFSADGQTVFIAWKNRILGYNTKTGKKTIEFKGLLKDIAGFGVFNISEIEHICAASVKGKILIWKADSAIKLCKKKLSHNIHSFKIIKGQENENFPKSIVVTENQKKIVFGLFDLTSESLRMLHTLKGAGEYYYDVGHGGKTLVILQDRRFIAVNLENFSVMKRRINKGRIFTAVACHAAEDYVITGDDTGRILLWHNIFSPEATQAIYHWHTLPVLTLQFSTSGSMFFSGGSECVIVKWIIEDPDQKKFLPRLPSAIKHISVSKNNMFNAISTEDNGIQIVDARFQLVSVVQHLVLAKKFPAGIKFDPRSKSLILNGIVGHVQFYSPQDMHLLYNLDITHQNKITGERNKTMINTEVIRVAISRSGHWMATAEERDDLELNYELRLKFWYFNVIKQTYELKSSIEYPHEKTILDIQFQPTANDKDIYCITISEENKFKLWQCESTEKGFQFNCTGIGYYKNFIPKSASFSSDGSIVAVAFNSVLTLWLPDTIDLKASLLHPTHGEDLKQIQFGTGNDCHLICSISENRLSVWNILTLCINWTVPLDCHLLVADPFTRHFALFTRQKKLYIFMLHSSTPVFESKNNLLKGKGDIVGAAFIPGAYSNDTSLNWHQRSRLYFIDSNQELYNFEANEELAEPALLLQEDVGESIYKSTLSRIRATNIKQDVPYSHLYSKQDKVIENIMYAPNTTKLPIHLTCGSVLLSMVHQK